MLSAFSGKNDFVKHDSEITSVGGRKRRSHYSHVYSRTQENLRPKWQIEKGEVLDSPMEEMGCGQERRAFLLSLEV
jgi:hypothetical protein